MVTIENFLVTIIYDKDLIDPIISSNDIKETLENKFNEVTILVKITE